MINLNDFKNEITSIPNDEPVFIYIGVGAASSVGAKGQLLSEHYHQFPPFLQDMHNRLPHLHLFLLLFDPYQESPPKVATDYALIDHSNSDHHYSRDFLHVFVFRHAVYTQPDFNHREGAVDITATLRDLNQFVKENRISLLYHDFTGRRTALVAEYFDHENKTHLDQIVYDMSGREDHGCFFDLTQTHAYFPFRVDHSESNARPIIKMFNYYKYSVNNAYEKSVIELQQFPAYMHHLADVQKNQIINAICTKFKNTNIALLRQVRKQIIEPQPDDPAYSTYIFNDAPFPYRKIFEDLYNEKNYDLLYEIIFNYSADELNILSKLKEMDMTGQEILTFITADADPYKWYNTIKGLLQ